MDELKRAAPEIADYIQHAYDTGNHAYHQVKRSAHRPGRRQKDSRGFIRKTVSRVLNYVRGPAARHVGAARYGAYYHSGVNYRPQFTRRFRRTVRRGRVRRGRR